MSTHTTPPEIKDRRERHQYELEIDGKLAGWIHYRMRSEDTIDLVHTEVRPELEGRGLARRLAGFALEDARGRGLKVIPSCSYIRDFVQRHAEFQDLVATP